MVKGRIILKPTPLLRKQAGQLRKLLGLWEHNRSNTGKLKLNEKSTPIPAMQDGKPTFLYRTVGLDQTHITRRQIVLNRHFTEIISDFLSNNLKKKLDDIGVTITSIETKAWNKGVNIFYSTNKPFNQELHQDLNSLITQLRSCISERRLIGRTPMINFVYDTAAELDRNLASILQETTISHQPEVENDLVSSSANEIQPSQSWTKVKPKLMPNMFTPPKDMTNVMLGLDYTSLYNKVASKLEHGRGESSRMISNFSVASVAKPILKIPLDSNIEDEDPTKRILNMKMFLISQRKKAEYQARLRRQEELIYRDSYKWDLPEAETQ